MKSLARMIREKAEREARKAEKERIKKEKEAAKLKEKKEKRKKLLKKRNNHRYYKKKRDKQLEERRKKGDVYSYHLILIMRDYKRKKRVAASWWMTDAYEKYNDAIEKNQAEVQFPVKIYERDGNKRGSTLAAKPVYEIMLLQRTPEGQTINKFRDEDGKFVDNVIIDNESYTIIDKHEWLVEESFNVFGYHPIRDRKNFDFILNEMILKDVSRDNIKTICTHSNKVIIQYNDDLDFITCKSVKEAVRLADALEKKIGKNPYVIFTGKNSLSTWMLNKLEEKTGWDREKLRMANDL